VTTADWAARGRRAAITEAVAIRRELAAATPRTRFARPRRAVDEQPVHALAAGAGEEDALAAITEAVPRSTEMAADRPDAFLPRPRECR